MSVSVKPSEYYSFFNHKTEIDTKYIQFRAGKYEIRKTINGKPQYFGRYETLKEAQQIRNHYEKKGWKQEKKENPTRNIYKHDNQWRIEKSIKGHRHHYGSYPLLEYAQYLRDRLEECNYDEKELSRIKQEYPKYYTEAIRFYQMIRKIDSKTPWQVMDTRKQPIEIIAVCSKVEDALWERDLYLEYEDDIQSICEDTRPNPYYEMKLPYWQTRRPRGGTRFPRSFKQEINNYIKLIKKGTHRIGEAAKASNCNPITIRTQLRHYGATWTDLKYMVQNNVDPWTVLKDQRVKIIQPDLNNYRSPNNYVHKGETPGTWTIQRKKIYYGTYPDKKLAQNIAYDLKQCDWDKKELPRIQKKFKHKSMVMSKKWVYPNKPNGEVISWSVRHKDKSRKMINYGTYKDYSYATLVRYYLICCGWDKSKLVECQRLAQQDLDMVNRCWRV